MALNGDGMGELIKSKIIALYGPPLNDTELTQWCHAIGQGVVEHTVANGTVPFPVKVQVSLADGKGATIEDGKIL